MRPGGVQDRLGAGAGAAQHGTPAGEPHAGAGDLERHQVLRLVKRLELHRRNPRGVALQIREPIREPSPHGQVLRAGEQGRVVVAGEVQHQPRACPRRRPAVRKQGIGVHEPGADRIDPTRSDQLAQRCDRNLEAPHRARQRDQHGMLGTAMERVDQPVLPRLQPGAARRRRPRLEDQGPGNPSERIERCCPAKLRMVEGCGQRIDFAAPRHEPLTVGERGDDVLVLHVVRVDPSDHHALSMPRASGVHRPVPRERSPLRRGWLQAWRRARATIASTKLLSLRGS